ncbi:hypothetical protein GH714_017476 [Hevea brasiliensis]|uniref:SNF2 N-terminal domain-containing protein n=1 Tax=Hevea brasiliensis TaxID=3981 RepID=A0A6A6KW08_HEVBR|nr:hypothetical protein GH714_017476 [Hevea brasiliensis]
MKLRSGFKDLNLSVSSNFKILMIRFYIKVIDGFDVHGGNEQGEHDFSSEADDNNPNGSGSDLYYLYGPSSDSDDDSSRNKCEIVEDIEILGKKRKAEAQICIDVDDREDSFLASMSARNLHFSDFAEPSAKANVTEMESKNEPPPAQPPRAADIEVNAEKKKRVYRSNRKRDKVRSRPMWEILEEEHDEWIDEHITEDIDLDQQRFIVNETAEPPAELIMPLLRYQKEWLAWALKQEESETKGGILADEMGMGRPFKQLPWCLRKEKCCGRPRNPMDPHCYDFVITTYGTVEAEFRKYMMPPKKKCAYCGKLFYEKKLSVHLKYYCGPNASRSAKQSKQDRKKLNTAPLASMHVIESRIDESHGFQDDVMKGAWKRKQHGEENNIEAMENWEVKQALHKEKSLLYSVKWDRIILDEVRWHEVLRSSVLRPLIYIYIHAGHQRNAPDALTIIGDTFLGGIKYVEAGTVMNNYAHIFELITRLRQAVNHPYLIVYSKTAIQKGGNLFDAHNGQQDCGICHDPVKDRVELTSAAKIAELEDQIKVMQEVARKENENVMQKIKQSVEETRNVMLE